MENPIHKLMLLIIKLVVIFNVERLGWNVTMIHNNQITFVKKIADMSELDNDTPEFLQTIMSMS